MSELDRSQTVLTDCKSPKKISLSNRILAAMADLDRPVSAEDVADYLGGNHTRVRKLFRARTQNALTGKVYVVRKEPQKVIKRGSRPIFFFALGNQPDVRYSTQQERRRVKYQKERAALVASGQAKSQLRRAEKEKFALLTIAAPELEPQEMSAKSRCANKWVDKHINAMAPFVGNPWAFELIHAGVDPAVNIDSAASVRAVAICPRCSLTGESG